MSTKVNKIRLNIFFAASIVMLIFTQCNPTKYVPKEKDLLVKNTMKVNNQKVKNADARSVIRQKPNRSIRIPITKWVIWRPYLSIYNLGDPQKEKGFKHWLTDIGEPPTILDSALTIKSARQLGQYYFNNGYFLNEVEFVIERNHKRQRAFVTYNIYSGPQYYFNKVDYFISSPGVEKVVNDVRENSLIKAGKPYSSDVLEKERDRIVKTLRDRGYYAFSKSLVRVEADTSVGQQNVNISLIISNLPRSIGDSIYYDEHKPYSIAKVFIDPQYDFAEKFSNSSDTTSYSELDILQKHDPEFKPFFIESQVHFKPNELYNESRVKETYNHLTGNGIFQMADITFERVPTDTADLLNAFIKLEKYDKRTFSAEVEGTNTAGNYGIAGILTWRSRSVFGFGGGEISDLSIRGGLEAQVNINENNEIFNTREIGAEYGITFPRFLFAGKLNNRIPKRMEPTSRIFTSYSYQTRVEFERSIWTFGLLYNWRESRKKVHQINLIDINYVRLPRIDQDYLESLEFKTGFQDNLIMAIRYTFLYDNPSQKFQRQRNFFRASIETSGNVLSAANNSLAFDQDRNQHLIFNVPYAQYVKVDLDYRFYFNITEENQIATRLFLGSTYNYGNSPYLPPFEKSFLAGGSNDLRGWNAYRLGPGNFPKHLYTQGQTNYAAVAPIKITAHVEYRFPVIENFKGALFIDAGNIWIWNRPYDLTNAGEVDQALVDYGQFEFNSFYKQIATNTGVGLRYDFGFFAFRLDLGMKIWDPSEPINQRYVLPGLKWSNITYNIALGYPF